MGGGNRRRPPAGKSKKVNRGSKPHPKSSSSSAARTRNSLFVEGGFLSDWKLDSSSPVPVRGNQRYGFKSDHVVFALLNSSQFHLFLLV